MLKNGTCNTEDLNILGKFIFRFCKYAHKKDFIGSVLLDLGLWDTFQTWSSKFIVNPNQAVALKVLLTLI